MQETEKRCCDWVGVKYLREKQIQRVGVDGNEGEVCLVDREAR
jgi:hypothetical protein